MRNGLIFRWTFLVGALVHSVAGAVAYPSTPVTPTAKIEVTWTDAARKRDVPVLIVYPKGLDAKKPAAVIVFSHGLGGTRYSDEGYGEAWASHGYVVVFPQHAGSDSAVIGHGMMTMLMGKNDEQAFIDRIGDVHFVIDQVEKLQAGKLAGEELAAFKGKLDLNEIGVGGHSFGALTAQGIVGEKYSLDTNGRMVDRRVKAGVVMSGNGSREANQDRAFGAIHVPVFYLTGTADKIGLVDAAQRRIPFDHSAFPSTYLLTLAGANHMTFVPPREGGIGAASAGKEKYEPFIAESTLAFWDAYLKGDARAKEWLERDFAKDLGTAGVFEQKSGRAAK